MNADWKYLIRFIAVEDGQIYLGEINPKEYPDFGVATFAGKNVVASLINGSIYDGIVTSKTMTLDRLLSPIDAHQIPLIRSLGLNYLDHTREANMPVPDTPVLFIKPRTAINGPYPAAINIPKIAQDGSADYEAELAVVISRDGRDISESNATDYVLGYTCSNDVSARTQQFKNSQWCFSLDGSAPLGPVLVSPRARINPHALGVKAIHNGDVVQDTNTREMMFSIAKTISFISSGTTLERGTVVVTGTGPGIGCMRDPKVVLNDGDDMRVEIEGIGTLNNRVQYE